MPSGLPVRNQLRAFELNSKKPGHSGRFQRASGKFANAFEGDGSWLAPLRWLARQQPCGLTPES